MQVRLRAELATDYFYSLLISFRFAVGKLYELAVR